VIVVSDTNVLSSFAAAEALPLLFRLFAQTQFYVPSAVHEEILTGFDRGNTYLQTILQAVADGLIIVVDLSQGEKQALAGYPSRLNQGEREAIAITVTRQATLLSNDKRALRYCRQHQIRAVSLVDLFRLLWVRRIVSQEDVRTVIARMEQVEHLILTAAQVQVVFAPRHKG
jgi:predicted nucleic acid-binding protein